MRIPRERDAFRPHSLSPCGALRRRAIAAARTPALLPRRGIAASSVDPATFRRLRNVPQRTGLVSEILPAPGVDLVGPLPAEVQSYVSFAAGASTNPAHAGAEKALLLFLNSAAVASVFKAKGLETR